MGKSPVQSSTRPSRKCTSAYHKSEDTAAALSDSDGESYANTGSNNSSSNSMVAVNSSAETPSKINPTLASSTPLTSTTQRKQCEQRDWDTSLLTQNSQIDIASELATLKLLVAELTDKANTTSNQVGNVISRVARVEQHQQIQQRNEQQPSSIKQPPPPQSKQPVAPQSKQPLAPQSEQPAEHAEPEFTHPKKTVKPSTIKATNNVPVKISNAFHPLASSGQQYPTQLEPELELNCSSRSQTQHHPQPNQRRPIICCTENHLNNFQPIRPGRASFANAARQGPKVFIATDSMAQRIRKREFYAHLRNGFARIKPFPGVTASYLHHYILPHLIEECPNTLVLHVGTNSIHDRSRNAEKIADEVINIGLTAKEFGVENIIISGLIMRRNGVGPDQKRRAVNDILKTKCILNNFIYINNDVITLDDIDEDRVHLLEFGSVKLANNILRVLNSIRIS